MQELWQTLLESKKFFKHRRSPKTSQEVSSPTSTEGKKKLIISSFVAMICLTSKQRFASKQ